MNDLNELLKRKAKKRLQEELSLFLIGIRDHKLFKAIEETKVIVTDHEGKEKQENLRLFFWGADYSAGKIITNNLLEQYVFEEAQQFIQKVEDFQIEIDSLKNSQND